MVHCQWVAREQVNSACM